jgi:uracil-DNA glycosylase family 4
MAEIAFPTIVSSRRTVPNEQPVADPGTLRVAVIGEAPGEEEENHRRPFIGPSGKFLMGIMRDVGLDRTKCLMGNVCQVRPPGNRIEAFDWNGPEIQEGMEKLNEDIRLYNPNIVLCLGGTPLHWASGSVKKVTEWRGSLFRAVGVGNAMLGRKCISSLHPAFVLREFSGYPLLKFDLKRAVAEGHDPTLTLPQRELITHLSADELTYLMDSWEAGQRCSLDIEGGLGGWPCVSICARPTKSITIAWGKFNEGGHAHVLKSFANLMWRRDVPKVLQNSLYDNFVLSYGFAIPIRNVVEDTMLKGWETYCELPKGLGTQTSIWTREPFYKAERRNPDPEVFFQYCAKDSAVTLEICNAQDNVLSGDSLNHYRKNMEMLNPLLYMEVRGIKYDQSNVDKEKATTRAELNEIGKELCEAAGSELRGEKGSLSSKRLAKCLYETKGYPPQFKKEQGRKTEKLTTDVEALLHLRKKFAGDAFLNGILRHRHLEGILETLNIKPDPDGRVRCGYNAVGTETGRLTCYTSPTGAGANLQTITKKLRKNYIADEGYDFFQCDLAGADGWTVAAHCARLGDRTMLDDYNEGLKPAKILALLYDLGADVNTLDRDSLRNLGRVVDPDGWLYFSSKRTQHGSNYLMGIPTMVTQVMKDSYKLSGEPIYLEHANARALQGLYFLRYPGLRKYHAWAESKLVADGTLVSASGQKRIFFGRRFGNYIHDTVKEFLSHEPQSNTTYSTNLAMLNLWSDPENRWPDGSLIIEPLHQVHDALCGQWPRDRREWAKKKVTSYFNNTLTIAGISIVIPFEGKFGRSWGELTEDI